jgi:hypothetical protein
VIQIMIRSGGSVRRTNFWRCQTQFFFLDFKNVRRSTNLQVQYRLEVYEVGMFPWDIEMTVEESLSDDEDRVPHDVSDSESESENDSD